METSSNKWLQSIALLLGVIVLVLTCWVLQTLRSILLPFCIALFLVYLAEPLQRFLVRCHVHAKLRVTIVLLVSSLLLYLVGQLVYSSANSLIANLPQYEQRFFAIIEQGLHLLALPSADAHQFITNFDWKSHINTGAGARAIGQGFGSFLGFLGNVFMVIVYMVYLLFERETFQNRVRKGFEPEKADRIITVIDAINHKIVQYLSIKTGISLLTGLLVVAVLFAFGVDFAIFWGIVTFLLNFIPAMGSIIATIPPLTIAFLQFDSFSTPFLVGALLMLIQGVIGNVIEPKVMGSGLGLSPLVVILGLIFWGWLWGPVGMILSVPILSGIKIICDQIELLRPVSRFLGDE